jgi:AcrR family transcriptional regulator
MLSVIMQSRKTRDRMIVSTALLLREKGLTGTSFGDVIDHSGAPRGSIYHHFPEGKAQLVEEAMQYAGGYVADFIGDADPIDALHSFKKGWRKQLERSDFRAGCPIVAVAVEAHSDAPQLAEAAANAFATWQEAMARLLERDGVEPARARRLAATTVAAVEGAVVICRAQRSMKPLDDVSQELEAMLKTALGR